MGAWGFGIFDDDTACDVRDAYNQLLADGQTGSVATRTLRKDFKDVLDDEDDGPTAWLALAATQWRLGRLEDRIKNKAIKIIDNGSSLHRWAEDPKVLKRREIALQKLRDLLLSKQPPEKKIAILRPTTGEWDDWTAGEYISYRIREDRYAILQVQYVDSRGKRNYPTFAVMDWVGAVLPRSAEIKKLPIKDRIDLSVWSDKEIPVDRMDRLGVKSTPRGFQGSVVIEWKELNYQIKKTLGLR